LDISTIEIAILVLAVWRLSSLLADEDGPFDFLEKLRTWFWIRERDGERLVAPPPTDGRSIIARLYITTKKTLADGMLCRWCSSVWFGIIFTGIYFIWPGVTWIAFPFALSTLSIMVDAAITNWYRKRR